MQVEYKVTKQNREQQASKLYVFFMLYFFFKFLLLNHNIYLFVYNMRPSAALNIVFFLFFKFINTVLTGLILKNIRVFYKHV